MDMMTVLQCWDGKTTASLQSVVRGLKPQDYDALLAACRDEDEKTGRAASWVLKAAYENGLTDIPYPADLLRETLHWEIALHLLQSVRHAKVTMPAENVQPYLTHQKPMVRAYALDAYVALSGADADAVLKQAAADPAASVRARARNLAK